MGNYLDARYIDIHKESASPPDQQRDVIKKSFILDETSHKKCTIFPQLLKICNNVNYIEGRPFPSFIFLCHNSKQICIVMPLTAFSPNIVSRFGEKKCMSHHPTIPRLLLLSAFFNDCKQNKASLLCTNKIIIRVCQLLCPLPCICLFFDDDSL